MPTFVPGLELSQRFFREADRPVLDARFPHLHYAAARLGPGSDVLGFDTAMSADHDWGPCVDIFLPEDGFAATRDAVHAALRDELPPTFLGYPTQLAVPDSGDGRMRHVDSRERGFARRPVGLHTVRHFILDYLGFDIEQELAPADWLTLPEQKLRSIGAGTVFHDAVGIEDVQRRLAYYPHDVWLYLLAAGWARVGQEEHLMGRAGSAGDEIGAALIAARLVRDLMRLCFLMERTYAPYAKWFGTAFGQLGCASALIGHLHAVLASTEWQERERHLVPVYEAVAKLHNALGVTDPLPTTVHAFFDRPFQVIARQGFADALLARITDARVWRIAARPLIGSVDQFSDGTDLVTRAEWRARLRVLYE